MLDSAVADNIDPDNDATDNLVPDNDAGFSS